MNGGLIDSIEFTYINGKCLNFGTTTDGGKPQPVVMLKDDEYITKINQRYGDSLDCIRIYTNLNNQGYVYGNLIGGEEGREFVAPSGYMIVGLVRDEVAFCGKILNVITRKVIV